MIRWLREFFRRAREINDVARAFDAHGGSDAPKLTDSERVDKRSRDFTDWDVAEAAMSDPEPERGHVEYRFLGITGMEDE